MSQLKIYRLVTVLLLILNIGMLVFFLSTKGPRPKPSNRHLEHIKELLDLNTEQSADFKSLVLLHKETMGRISENQRILLNEYFAPLKSPESKIEKGQLLNKYHAAEKQKLEATYTHFKEVKALLNSEQLLPFNKFMDEALDHVLGNQEIKAHPPKDFKH